VLLTPANFHAYQARAIEHGLEHPRSALHLFMSAGKTVISLTVIKERINRLETTRALVLAPLQVARTVWKQEVQKWEHLQDLNVSVLWNAKGDKATLLRELHRKDVDIHVINYESIPWLVRTVFDTFLAKGKVPPWNTLVLDEVDRFKDSQGKRFQQFEKLLVPPSCKDPRRWAPDPDALTYFPFRITQTGTPNENGLQDLHGQYRVLDGGKRLYWFVGDFRNTFCLSIGDRQYNNYKVETDAAKNEIIRRIADITLSLNEKEHIKLPDYMFHDHWVDLPPKIANAYKTLEKQMFAQLDRHEDDPLDGEWRLEVESSPSARMKCRQLANGAVITPEGSTLVHDEKIHVLDRILHEANGKPVLLSYAFRADCNRILARYKKAGWRCAYIGPGAKNVEEIVTAWNRQEYHLLVSHGMSIGHGLNLQNGGNEIVWFGLTDNPRVWHQFNARLRRQGQVAESVHVRRIIARNTIDEVLMQQLEDKNADAQSMRRRLEAYRVRHVSQ